MMAAPLGRAFVFTVTVSADLARMYDTRVGVIVSDPTKTLMVAVDVFPAFVTVAVNVSMAGVTVPAGRTAAKVRVLPVPDRTMCGPAVWANTGAVGQAPPPQVATAVSVTELFGTMFRVFEELSVIAGAAAAATTGTLTVEIPPQVMPLQTASWMASTTGAEPAANVGAMNVCVGCMLFMFSMTTGGPDTCCQV